MPTGDPITSPQPDAFSPTDGLFVYGTLKSGFNNAPAVSLREAATLLGPGSIGGRMYAVCGPRGALRYPAAVPSDDPADRVHGELYRLNDPDVLRGLDAYEGCAPGSPTPHEYRRDQTIVTLADGRQHAAWVYWYTAGSSGLQRLEGGIFPYPTRG